MIENKTFEQIDFRVIELDEEYYNCKFIECVFSEKRIYETDFEECSFKGCNLTMAKFRGV